VQVHLANEAVRVFTRRGNDWTNRFKKVAADGTTDFSVLQNELKGKSTKIVMVAFDLLYLNGYDLRKLPLIERKTHLKKLIDGTDIQFSESFEVDGSEMYAHACKVGLEGVVSKVRDSKYHSGRGNDWVTKTCAQRETLVIAGFALDGSKWDGLYLARRKGADLIYAGKIDHGFDKASATELRERLTPLSRRRGGTVDDGICYHDERSPCINRGFGHRLNQNAAANILRFYSRCLSQFRLKPPVRAVYVTSGRLNVATVRSTYLPPNVPIADIRTERGRQLRRSLADD